MKQALRSFVTTRDGRVVIGQSPNVPIIGWLVLMLASFMVGGEPWHGVLSFLSGAFLFTWAYLELTQGVNGFRRMLGAVVLVGLVAWRFWWGG